MVQQSDFGGPYEHGRTLQRTLSASSLESLLPPPTPYKKFILGMIALLSITTVGQLIICCVYSDISGNAGHWYARPHSWQFCMVYADSTIQAYDQKLLDSTTSQLAYIGLMNALYTWVALAVTFRALYHFEWIPSTVAFLLFDAFGQLCYYQSNNLVVVPPKLVSSLASFTAWFSPDMYDQIGKLCYDATASFALNGGAPIGDPSELFDDPKPNCTNRVIVLDESIQSASGVIDKFKMIIDSSVKDGELNCRDAVTLHWTFLIFNYVMLAITLTLLVVLVKADFELRQSRPQRHYFKESGQDLAGSRVAQVLVGLATIGYIFTSIANCDAAIVALECVKTWRVIDSVGVTTYNVETQNFGELDISLDTDVTFDTKGYFPFKINQLDLQTVLLIITVMSVIRGSFKQSVAGFRLAGVTSLLAIIVQWPPIVGNMETFDTQDLWWWKDSSTCRDYHSGKVYFYPNRDQSMRYCNDTRLSILGALITFIALHINIIVCFLVYKVNMERKSLALDIFEFTEEENALIQQGYPFEDDGPSEQSKTKSPLTAQLLEQPTQV